MPSSWPRPLPLLVITAPIFLMWAPTRAFIGATVGKITPAARLLSQALRRKCISRSNILLCRRASGATAGSGQRGKVIVITGPTATGKSAIALALCKRLSGEIVSCDSVQVYRDLHIGANKASTEERQQVPHHLIDIVSLDQTFTAGNFVRRAQEAIDDILSRGRVPVVVGGTMMYVQWLVQGTPDAPKKDPAVAEAVAAELLPFQERGDWDGALQLLSAKNGTRASSLCRNDWYRLSRSLEVIRGPQGGAEVYTGLRRSLHDKYDFRSFFIVGDRERLFRRIDQRCESMLERGLLVETAELLVNGALDPASPAGRAIGYRQAIEYLHQEARQEEQNQQPVYPTGRHQDEGIDEARTRFLEFYSSFATKTRQYAGEQMKWFRSPKGKEFCWQAWTLGDDSDNAGVQSSARTRSGDIKKGATANIERPGDGRDQRDVTTSIEERFGMSREAFTEELNGDYQAFLRAENTKRARDMKRYMPTVTVRFLGHEPILRRLILEAEQLSLRVRDAEHKRRSATSAGTRAEMCGWSSGNR